MRKMTVGARRGLPWTIPFLFAASWPSLAESQDARVIELSAAQPAARGTPVECALPAGAPFPSPAVLCPPGGNPVPLQILEGNPPAAFWILERDMEAGEKREYRLEKAAGAPGLPRVECRDVDGRHLVFRAGDRDVLRYNYGTIQPPAGVDEVFARSGYLHPVWTPGGRVITNDFPAKHLHHHGIWFPWTSSEFEGRKSDFWNSKSKQGKVECLKVEGTFSGPAMGGFRARHRFTNLNAPDGPRAALDETWEVRVWAHRETFLFDLVSVQTCATPSPLVIKKYYYGGLGFRGSADWEGKQGVEFLTSEGRKRTDGNATPAKWCIMTGKVEGKEASIGFLCHPSNFRFPQGMRLHPDEPFFNWAPSQGGDFEIQPGKPYVSRYRFVVRDGPLAAAEMDLRWAEYAEPPRASLKK